MRFKSDTPINCKMQDAIPVSGAFRERDVRTNHDAMMCKSATLVDHKNTLICALTNSITPLRMTPGLLEAN